MANEQVLFCGSSPAFLKEELTKESNEANGGIAFRIPSLINANGTLIAAIDRASCGADWGYIEIAVRRSEDGGKTWSNIETIAVPPARETRITSDSYASAFFIDPCMAIAPNGDVIMLVDFWPECKGLHKKKLLDKKKIPYAKFNNEMCPLIYDRNGAFYYITKDGKVFDSSKKETDYTVKNSYSFANNGERAAEYTVKSSIGALHKGNEYVGNIYLNGAMGKNEMGAETTFGAPLKAPKRSYVFMMRSSDNGKTWSEPKDITNMILRETDGTFLGVAPGVGLTTKTGRIIMPLYVDRKECVSVFSDDNGETWHRTAADPYAKNIDEWQLIEADDGTLLGVGRQKSYGKAPLSISRNNGKNWIKNGKTAIYAPKCQKSIITASGYVFCSHPSERKRENGVLSVGKIRIKKGFYSYIEWLNHIVINEGFFAYSCLTQVDENTIGILYESQPGSYLEFKTYKIDELI